MTLLEGFDQLAQGLDHPEGVTWSPFDGLLYAGGEGGEIYSVSLGGEVTLLGANDGSMLGLCVDGRGRVYACDVGNGAIARFDPSSKTFETYATGPGGREMDTPNVCAFDAMGSLYVTCSGEDGMPEILRVTPDGEVARWTDAVPAYPNGCLVTPDGSALIVVEAKAERIVRVAIEADGSAGAISTVAELPDTDADGITLDADGALWVTLYRPDGIVRIAPDGTTELVIDDHLASTFDAPTNLAFAGPALRSAVIANVGGDFLSVGDLGAAGAPLHYPELP